jgi:hypothetical protein
MSLSWVFLCSVIIQCHYAKCRGAKIAPTNNILALTRGESCSTRNKYETRPKFQENHSANFS